MGSVNVTESGRECLFWRSYSDDTEGDLLSPDPTGMPPINTTKEHFFLNQNSVIHHNYCRNPYRRERPWCFVSDNVVQWEYCYIPMCTDHIPPACKLTELGGEYVGRRNVTMMGRPCLPWRSTDQTDFSTFPDSHDVNADHNFCRNNWIPGSRVAPWCFIEAGSSSKWEYCAVGFCERRVEVGAVGHVYPECRLSEKGIEYVGRQNETATGKACLKWENVLFNQSLWDLTHPYFIIDYYDLKNSINMDNYCRNFGRWKRPWCLVSDYTSWEYCDIPFCHDPNPPECKLSRPGGEYVGKLNMTISGYPCKPWLSMCPGDIEFCKDLHIGFADELDGPSECQLDRTGKEYIGTKNKTKKGFQCQPWLSNSPNSQLIAIDYHDKDLYDGEKLQRGYMYTNAWTFPDDLYPQHNYCRNPNGDEAVWCYKASGEGRDYCEVPECP
ncbi:unnamed protein product [Darwinula stevensoni]|uniref:Kringle domain-containing protein n=1 Tax=Darwinula stevensoni TaxID=69355 RepID=A0A7R9FN52_9CRUS|nr:unnamed protein product [Darwinula stevensoni]CAG0896288.1 unnamed protein product [Darwinula stevensoni]